MNAVVLLSVIAAAVAETPYNLPRPGPHAPVFNYHPAPAPPQFIPQPQAPQPQSNGYNYQRPSPPSFPQPAPHPQYYQPIARPAPQPLPIHYQPQPIQQQPQPLPVHYPQPHPQPIYIPQQFPQPQPIYQPQPILPPSTSYGIPQLPAPVQPIHPLPAIIAQPQPAPIQYYQQQQQQVQQQPQVQQPQVSQGYSYPQAQPAQHSQLSVQSQQSSASVSSYQADSFQYNNAQQSQTHRDALDDTVVSQVQNIIKDSEHSSAKEAGYLSLVSGVSLGKATPSVEVLSFVHNSPVSVGSSQSSQSSGQAQSNDFSLPSDAIRSGFVPQDKPASSYGVPN